MEDDGSADGGQAEALSFLDQVTKMVQFEPSVVIPGDDVTARVTLTGGKQLRLGPGLLMKGERVVATRAGMLRFKSKRTFWVESNQKRYVPRAEDQVIGVVEDRVGDYYRVGVWGTSPTLLPLMAFDGATKRNKPNLRAGSLVFCRVVNASKDMEPELTCCAGASSANKKDWMTGEAIYGELRGGLMMRCSAMHARSMLRPDCVVLNALGRRIPFEVVIGLNGAFWVNAKETRHVVALANAILNADVMDDAETEAMVERLWRELLKKDKEESSG